MNDTSGRTSSTPFAYYDPNTRSLRTSQGTLALGLTECSPTLPRSGSMRNGELFERPTLALPTDESGCSSLLPTPSAMVANDGETPRTWLERRERVKVTANNGNGMGMPLTIAVQLLPTPLSRDYKGPPGGRFNDGNLCHVVVLLPTPTAADSRGTRNATANRSPNSSHHTGQTLTDVFGAIMRQQSTDGNESLDDPHPTQPNQDATANHA